jgi:anaerobic selenocysteine-containing dehydrogenase
MVLKMNPEDAAEQGVVAGETVTAGNHKGEADFILQVTDRVPRGVVVAEGAWWIQHAPGGRTVNALTSQRLTDRGRGSTFYDTKVEVKPAGTTKTPSPL